VWAAGYGGQTNSPGDSFGVGSHDSSVSTFGYAAGLDYLVTPDTRVGFALAGGGTSFALSDSLSGGHSDMFQAAAYSSTHIDAAYISAALAYAWHRVSTERYATPGSIDQLTQFDADFSANDVGGRIEGGYRFAIPAVLDAPGRYGFTPYAAAQVQTIWMPSYSESAASASDTSNLALAYDARATTTFRSELGDWFDWSIPVDRGGATLQLLARTAWVHDFWPQPNVTAIFDGLPSSSFTVTGVAPPSDLLLASAGATIWLWNGLSLTAQFDGEFAEHSQKYVGTARVRYMW
jgi:uncharacterized protein with beta-barrel porin domain